MCGRVLRAGLLGHREDEPLTVDDQSAERRSGVEQTAGNHDLDKDPLLAAPAWNMALAFYGRYDDMVPAFEIRETLYKSGVVGDAQVIYDEFSLAYTLEELETLPAPRC